jgi:hypothetical protein
MREDLARVKALVGIMPHLSDGFKQEAVQAGSRVVQSVKDEWPTERDVVTAFDSLASKYSLKSSVEIKGSVGQSNTDANDEVKRDVDKSDGLKEPQSPEIVSLPKMRDVGRSDGARRFAVTPAHSDANANAKRLLAESVQDQNNHPTPGAKQGRRFDSVKDEVSAAFPKTKIPQRSLK